jgi:hypothetical protein
MCGINQHKLCFFCPFPVADPPCGHVSGLPVGSGYPIAWWILDQSFSFRSYFILWETWQMSAEFLFVTTGVEGICSGDIVKCPGPLPTKMIFPTQIVSSIETEKP